MTHQTECVYAKLLYGTAFRSPSYREYLAVAAFNDALEPEHLHTFEAQAGFHRSGGDINLTLYANDYRDFIKDLWVSAIQSPAGLRVVDDEKPRVPLKMSAHPLSPAAFDDGRAKFVGGSHAEAILQPSRPPA